MVNLFWAEWLNWNTNPIYRLQSDNPAITTWALDTERALIGIVQPHGECVSPQVVRMGFQVGFHGS